jgi:hypothetical protein
MSTEDDRRAEGTTRIPFDALVEVGGALGPSFEAQAIDISEDGMHLRTAYLPEVGQPLTCRFEAGSAAVLASGEVVWRQEEGRGGEFGIRFTNLDPQSATALTRIVGIAPTSPHKDPGARVRLHIEGLGSPMRARVRDAKDSELTVGSELGFLQVGKQLELEDAATGSKRPARIDRVDVEVDPTSHVPQLVVTLRYDDVVVPAEEESPTAVAKESTPGPSVIGDELPLEAAAGAMAQTTDDLDSIRKASDEMKGALARGASRVTPALITLARRAQVTLALLWAKRKHDADSLPIPLRRTTAPPPGGGLHASGRRVVRGEGSTNGGGSAREMVDPPKPGGAMKRRVMAGGALVAAGTICFIVMHKPAQPAGPAAAGAGDTTTAQATPQAGAGAAQAPLAPALNPMPPATTEMQGLRLPGAPPLATPPAADVEATGLPAAGGSDKHHHVGHVPPFGNGPVAHGPVLRLKMDGDIDKIEGAAQPTGFTVEIPGRRSLEPAAPLAQRDSRIASIHVANDPGGAQLTLAFRDGVPNYQVRARGDTLEIALAPVGRIVDDDAEEAHASHHTETPTALSHKHGVRHLERR